MSCMGPPPSKSKTPKVKNGRVSADASYTRPPPQLREAKLGPAVLETKKDNDTTTAASPGESKATTSTNSTVATTTQPADTRAKWVVAMDMGERKKGDPIKLDGTEITDGKLGIKVFKTGEKVFIEQVSDGTSTIRMVLCALDYKNTANPLTATVDAKNMLELAKACGVSNTTVMIDEMCTKEAILRAIKRVGSQCKPDDYFVFYFAGHGVSVKDTNGDEKDGADEAFLTYKKGEMLTDDVFSAEVLSACHKDVRILIITDCCHSGTIADLGTSGWEKRQAIAMSGCMDEQCAADTGRGGIFTHSLLMAADKLGDHEQTDYSVGMFYNSVASTAETVFKIEDKPAQNIVIHTSPGFKESQMAWPLVPPPDYEAPFTKLAKAEVTEGAETTDRGVAAPQSTGLFSCNVDPEREKLKKLGIQPSQKSNSANLQGHLDQKKDPKYLAHVQGKDQSGCTVM